MLTCERMNRMMLQALLRLSGLPRDPRKDTIAMFDDKPTGSKRRRFKHQAQKQV